MIIRSHMIIRSNHLVLINGKLQDIIWHPLKTSDQDPKPLTMRTPEKMGLEKPKRRKEEPKRNKNYIPKKIQLLEKKASKDLISKNI